MTADFFGLFVLLVDFVKDVIDRGRFNGPVSADVSGSGLGVDLDVGDSGSILTPVDLLLHQDVESIGCKGGRSVLIDVILSGFSEPD